MSSGTPDETGGLKQEDQSTEAGGRVFETDIPARLERLPWGRFHVLVIAALGITWILDGSGGHARGVGRRSAEGEPVAQVYRRGGGACRQRLSHGRGDRRAGLRLVDRSIGTKEALLHHHRRLSDGDRAHRRLVERRQLLRVSLSDRRRNRRRIRRDQLDDPGTRARPVSRLYRPRHQRKLLDRRCDGRHRRGCAPEPRPHRSRARLAAGFPGRGRSRTRRVLHAHVDSGEPALAHHPRAARAKPRPWSMGSRRGFAPPAPISRPWTACHRGFELATIPRYWTSSMLSSGAIAAARWSVWCSWWRRRFSTTRYSSPMRWF